MKNVDEVEDSGNMQDGFHDMDTSDDHVECFIEGFGSDFDNKKRSEEEIEARYDKRKKTRKFWKEIQSNRNQQIYNKTRTDMTKDMQSTWVWVIQILQEDVGLSVEELNVIS